MPPNVIVFFTDQQRWDTTGVHGNPLDLTPNFDRMAHQGTHLYNTFTCQPVCGPARACLQTGLYATNTTVWRNGIHIPETSQTLAHFFKEAGYQTGYIGKWHLGPGHIAGPVEQPYRGGYDYWLASNLLEFTSDAYDVTLFDEDNQPVRLPGYRVDALTDAAIRFIDRRQQQPFYLFISYLEPHFQNRRDDYPAPDGYEERYIGRWTPPDLATLGGTSQRHLPGYYGMVKRLDEALGRLLDALKSLNLLDNTIVLFTTDHGNHFKTRNSEYKRSCHDSSVRLPCALIGPGFNGGGQLQQMISLVDLPPTLLDAAGLAIPSQMEGHSIMPLVRREAVDWQNEVFIQISESQVGRAIRTHRWKYSVSAKSSHSTDPDNRLGGGSSMHYTEEFLYDLKADPYELNNLIGRGAFREVADHLKKRLIARMIAAGEAEPEIDSAPPSPDNPQVFLRPEEMVI
ncbi:MAG TPA: sulfatase-like hydrolase/transferase [Anaerolineaceae bacterium]